MAKRLDSLETNGIIFINPREHWGREGENLEDFVVELKGKEFKELKQGKSINRKSRQELCSMLHSLVCSSFHFIMPLI